MSDKPVFVPGDIAILMAEHRRVLKRGPVGLRQWGIGHGLCPSVDEAAGGGGHNVAVYSPRAFVSVEFSSTMTLLFSYPGHPPSLSGATELAKLTSDDISGWRYVYNLCGGEHATTKASIRHKLQPYVGSLHWDESDQSEPLDFGSFLRIMSKLPTGRRCVVLLWAHASAKGHSVRADPNSVLMTCTSHSPTQCVSAAYKMAQIKAAQAQHAIDMKQAYEAALAKAAAARLAIETKAMNMKAAYHAAMAKVQGAQRVSEAPATPLSVPAASRAPQGTAAGLVTVPGSLGSVTMPRIGTGSFTHGSPGSQEGLRAGQMSPSQEVAASIELIINESSMRIPEHKAGGDSGRLGARAHPVPLSGSPRDGPPTGERISPRTLTVSALEDEILTMDIDRATSDYQESGGGLSDRSLGKASTRSGESCGSFGW